MPDVLGQLFTDEVLDRTINAERDGRVEERASVPHWAERWRAELPPGMRPLHAYFSANDASFSFIFIVEGSGVRALWKNGYDVSVEVELATEWLDALRRKDAHTLERLTSYPFELRDTEVEAHCGHRIAAGPKEMSRAVACLVDDPIFSKAMNRVRSKIDAAPSQDFESDFFKGWRRAKDADLWPVMLMISNGGGNEYDLTFLVAKNGVRSFWKRGSFTSGD